MKKPVICLFLLISLVGCLNTRTVYVPAPCTPIPADLMKLYDRTATTSSMTYCQAVLWIKPLLALIEKGNNNFSSIREIDELRYRPSEHGQ